MMKPRADATWGGSAMRRVATWIAPVCWSLAFVGCLEAAREAPDQAPPSTSPDDEDQRSPDASAHGGDDGSSVEPPIPWVNPSRCLPRCAEGYEETLVAIDQMGRVSPGSVMRFSREAQPHLEAMLAAAKRDSIKIHLGTDPLNAFRTHEEQRKEYLAHAEKEPGRWARPGHSEHELGLAVDIQGVGIARVNNWLEAHAPEFGFVLSYPKGKEKETGYRYESWHFRYVGEKIAAEIAAASLTLEEYFRRHPDRGVSGPCSECAAPEAVEPCGDATAAGECTGDVLTWCFDGTLNAVDCASSILSCKQSDEGAICAP